MTHPHAKPLYALGEHQATRLDDRGMVVHNTADPERWPQGANWGTTSYTTALIAIGFEAYPIDEDWRFFGVWVHLGRRVIVTYESGEVTEIQCGNRPNLLTMLKELAARFGPAPRYIYTNEMGQRFSIARRRPGGALLAQEADDARTN